MTLHRRGFMLVGILGPLLPGCATTYARFRQPPSPDWGYVVASTAIELPSSLRITTSAFGGTMVGTEDNFMLLTNIAMISRQKLDVSTTELAASIGVQALPPASFELNHIGYYSNAMQSWRIVRDVSPSRLAVQSRTVIYLGEYRATREGSMRVVDQSARDLPIALSQQPELAKLPLSIQVPGAASRVGAWPTA